MSEENFSIQSLKGVGFVKDDDEFNFDPKSENEKTVSLDDLTKSATQQEDAIGKMSPVKSGQEDDYQGFYDTSKSPVRLQLENTKNDLQNDTKDEKCNDASESLKDHEKEEKNVITQRENSFKTTKKFFQVGCTRV